MKEFIVKKPLNPIPTALDKTAKKLESARFTGEQWSDGEVEKIAVVNVIFSNCNLTNANWEEGYVARVEFIDSHLTGF